MLGGFEPKLRQRMEVLQTINREYFGGLLDINQVLQGVMGSASGLWNKYLAPPPNEALIQHVWDAVSTASRDGWKYRPVRERFGRYLLARVLAKAEAGNLRVAPHGWLTPEYFADGLLLQNHAEMLENKTCADSYFMQALKDHPTTPPTTLEELQGWFDGYANQFAALLKRAIPLAAEQRRTVEALTKATSADEVLALIKQWKQGDAAVKSATAALEKYNAAHFSKLLPVAELLKSASILPPKITPSPPKIATPFERFWAFLDQRAKDNPTEPHPREVVEEALSKLMCRRVVNYHNYQTPNESLKEECKKSHERPLRDKIDDHLIAFREYELPNVRNNKELHIEFSRKINKYTDHLHNVLTNMSGIDRARDVLNSRLAKESDKASAGKDLELRSQLIADDVVVLEGINSEAFNGSLSLYELVKRLTANERKAAPFKKPDAREIPATVVRDAEVSEASASTAKSEASENLQAFWSEVGGRGALPGQHSAAEQVKSYMRTRLHEIANAKGLAKDGPSAKDSNAIDGLRQTIASCAKQAAIRQCNDNTNEAVYAPIQKKMVAEFDDAMAAYVDALKPLKAKCTGMVALKRATDDKSLPIELTNVLRQTLSGMEQSLEADLRQIKKDHSPPLQTHLFLKDMFNAMMPNQRPGDYAPWLTAIKAVEKGGRH
jgi:hypothetical protein